MKIRTLAAGLLVGALTLTACGKEGTPTTGGTGETSGAPLPTYTVAQGVDVAGSATFAKIKSKGGATIGGKDDHPGLGLKHPTTGKFAGFDIEIAKLVAAGLGYDESKIT